jgi:hypothetical protein
MKRNIYLFCISISCLAMLAIAATYLPSPSTAQAPPTTYGTLDNFDVINDTGGDCHGFEIELEGITSADVAYTFGAPYQRYGDPTIVTTANGVIIRYQAVYSGGAWQSTVPGAPGNTPIAVAPYLPTQGHSCWTGGVADAQQYYTSGCDHFGASLNGVPTKTTYRWLVENPAAPGTLMRFGSNAPIPAPVWNVVPPATPGAEPIADAVIPPIAPEPGQMFGEPMWIKVYMTELPNAVHAEDLDHMVIDDPNVNIVPNEPAEIEWEWMLLQAKVVDGVITGERVFGGGLEVGAGTDSVSRRFEFYKYTGQFDTDPENLGEAMCDNPTALDQQLPASPRCGAPDENGVAGVGDLIGAQNAAVNLLGPVVVVPENHPPVAWPDTVTTDEDVMLSLLPAALLGNDTDSDGDVISVHSVQQAIGGSVTWDGSSIVFMPAANLNGPASFTYTIDDGYYLSTAMVSVAITAVNDTPIANAGPDQAARTGALVTLNGSASFDADAGTTLTYAWSFVSVPSRSKVALSGGGAGVNPTFKPDKVGTYVVNLIVNDGVVDSVADTVTITVTKGKK